MTSSIIETTPQMDRFKKLLNYSNMDHKAYQYEGVQWCLNNEQSNILPGKVYGGIIADEMGLGKTIMMIGLMYCNFVSTLIVVPPILLNQWSEQIYKTSGHKALVYHGTRKKKITIADIHNSPIVITTYGTIAISKKNTTPSLLHSIHWGRLIFDEAHHLRNNNTILYKGAYSLKASSRWLVTGTPIQNTVRDFYNLCAIIRLPDNKYKDKESLKEFEKHFILKRTKQSIGLQITNLHMSTTVVAWENVNEMQISKLIHSSLCSSGVNSTIPFTSTQTSKILGNSSKLVRMLRAKQSCIYPKLFTPQLNKLYEKGVLSENEHLIYKKWIEYSSKLNNATQYIIDRKDNGNGKIIFCNFRQEMDEIANKLRSSGIKRVATIDGRTTRRARTVILNEKNDALIIQIQTGCEGLNLQENYNEIYFISPHWNPAVEDQAIARCHRIGQTKDVFVKRFQMASFYEDDDTMPTRNIEHYVNDMQTLKRNIACDIL